MKRIFLLAGLAVAPAFVLAHHGWSEYDTSKVLKLTGKIVESGYEHPARPHPLRGAGQDLDMVTLAPPSRMENRGLPKEWLKPGATATVEGYPNRNKPEEMRAERITINGKTIELR